jgi:2-keto-3-deoxy-L-rhamnonate aldolase RhmA
MNELGLLTAEPSPLLLDQVASHGLSFLVVDAELTTLGPADCVRVVRRLAGTAVRTVVRVPDLRPETLVRFANTGVDELMLPQVRSLEQIECAWRSVRFPPSGTRPRQPTRASGYGTSWDDAPALSAIVETVEAVDVARDLAGSGLLAGAWFGATDLRDEVDRRGVAFDLEAVADELLERFESAGVPFGLGASDAAGARAVFDRGASRCFLQWERYIGAVLSPLAAVLAADQPSSIDPTTATASSVSGGEHP